MSLRCTSLPGEAIFKAYRTGLLRPSNSAGGELHASFSKCVQQTLMARVPLPERLRLHKIFQCCRTGVAAVREERYEDARQTFEEGRELLGTGMSVEATLVGKSFLYSMSAYLAYALGDVEEARKNIYTTLDTDVTLEEQPGYDVFQMHRLQALLNLIRVELQARRCKEAFVLSGEVVAFLEGYNASIGVHRSWRPESFLGLPRRFPRIMLVEIVEEVSRSFTGTERSEHWEVFTRAAHLEEYSMAPQPLHRRVRDWLLLKDAYLGGRDLEFLERLLTFLPQGMEDIRGIWYASMVDLLDFCLKGSDKMGRYTAQAILRDSIKWPRVPKALKKRLEPMRERVTSATSAA